MDNFYVQLAVAVVAFLSLVGHHFGFKKMAALADQVESMMPSAAPKQ